MTRKSIIITLAVLCSIWASINSLVVIGWVLIDHRQLLDSRFWNVFQLPVLVDLFYGLWAIESGWVIGMLGLYWLYHQATSQAGTASSPESTPTL